MRFRCFTRFGAVLAAALVCWAHTADAQRSGYDRYDRGDSYSGERNVAGQFDYYALVLSWSPTYCASPENADDGHQCNRRDGRRYAFVLHGLWPQYERGYPESCRTRKRPYVPQNIIDGMLDIMPSPRLVIHEYRKHGTCSGLNPASYFALSRRLFETIRIPERYRNPFETQFVSPENLASEFLKENPNLRPDMLAISCAGPGNRLREIRICMTRDGQPRACGRNENQRKMCSARSMYVPPVRSTRDGPDTGRHAPRSNEQDRNPSPLPGPRLIESPRAL
jgi:ribonuclease T2